MLRILIPHSSTPVVTLRNPAGPSTISVGLQFEKKRSLGTIWKPQDLPVPEIKASTVLERDHFYSDFLISQTTVSTNFNHLEDEARHLVDRREYSCLWRAVLVTFNYHRCSTERRFFLNYACARLCSRVRCKQEFSAASVRLNLPGWRWTRIM